jgi:hypothetical protein
MKYTVTGPDGKKWTVNAPEGASEQDAISYIAHAHYSKKSEPTKYDPTEGMSTFDKVAAGAGKAVYDAGRGIGNLFGMVSDEDVQQAHDRDKALMDTGAGVAGNVARQPRDDGDARCWAERGLGLAAKAPKLIKAGQALMVPKTVLGAGAQGAAWGAIEPVDGRQHTRLATS